MIFWIEPLVGKQLLPLLGGAPAVWNICLLFFQSALLMGYACAHGIVKIGDVRVQVAVCVLLFGSALLVLPVGFDTNPPASAPAGWLLGQLAIQLGLPFIALAAASPLLQRWYAGAAAGRDPYVLYAASNAGSLLALIAFPVVIEPAVGMLAQFRAWTALYAFAIVLIGVAGWLTVRAWTPFVVQSDATGDPPTVRIQLRWIALALVPSSLLLGVTSYLTTDLAPVPLLWVVPLALYLLTFVIAFGIMAEGPPRWLLRVVVILAVSWATIYRMQATDPLWLLLVIHLALFTALALTCHSRLAASRPAPAQLTRFYLLLGSGGALGGAFNALLAPLIFDSFAEYPLMLLAAVLLGLGAAMNRAEVFRALIPAAVMVTAVLIVFSFDALAGSQLWRVALTVAIPAIVVYTLSGKPLHFAMALAAVLLTGHADPALANRVLHAERNFFGLLRITTNPSGRYHELRHGSTLHGAADLADPSGIRPLTYYSYRSPVNDVMHSVQSRGDSLRIAVVGLGVGSLAWYARPTEQWVFYEINPAVGVLARDPEWFGFLRRSQAASLRIELGDARLRLRRAPDQHFDLLVLDAFTSDAIPLHLLTREAMQSYFAKLKAGGVLAIHVSNRYLDLTPSIARIAADLGLGVRARADLLVKREERAQRIEPSTWVALARTDADFGTTLFEGTWYIPRAAAGRAWTDDFSNLWQALDW
ncbi:MAG: fused MFS/spermidine synthase [Gemmatimonadota bacterium]